MKKTISKLFSLLKWDYENNIGDKKILFKRNKVKFISLLILLPLLSSFFYFYSLGRKRFFVRSDVVIRKASETSNSTDIANFLRAGNQSAIEDSYYLQTYLESPQVLRDLEKIINISKIYKKEGIDRYAGLKKDATSDVIYRFFRKQVSTTLDERTGILRIRSLAYDPITSFKLNNFLIDKAESFVNELNQSIFKEQLTFLNKQVIINENKLKDANLALSKFQQTYQILDVQAEAQITSSFLKELEAQLVKLKVELASIQRRFVDNNAPEILLIKDQMEELNNQIILERNILMNPNKKNLSKRIIEMNELKTIQKFAYDLYLASLKASEKAKVDSIQQQRFLAIISEPKIPEQEYMYWRHRGFLTTLSIFIILFSVTKFILGMADSHNN